MRTLFLKAARGFPWWTIPISAVSVVALTAGLTPLLLKAIGIDALPEQRIRPIGGWSNTFISLVIVAPIVEELLCRALLLNGLRNKWNFTIGTIGSSSAFCLMHVFGGFILWPSQFTFGVLASFAYRKSRTLLIPIMIHSIANFFNFLILFTYSGKQLSVDLALIVLCFSSPILLLCIYLWARNPKGNNSLGAHMIHWVSAVTSLNISPPLVDVHFSSREC